MAIDQFEFFHGAVLNRIISAKDDINFKTFPTTSNCSFVINNKTGIYIKYSRSRLTPWNFSFKKVHQEELEILSQYNKATFLILVCNNDGIVSINYSKLKKILNNQFDDFEWIKVHRFRREQYQISGSDGKLKGKIPKNNFPRDIILSIK